VVSLFRGRVFASALPRLGAAAHPCAAALVRHALCALSADTPALVVLAVPAALSDAERVAAVCSVLAVLPRGTGTPCVLCTDGKAYAVYVMRTGEGLGLVEEVELEFGTPGEYAEGLTKGEY
jgi:hypothetical protein